MSSTRKLLTAGKIINGVPVSMASPEFLQSQLNLPRKKVAAASLHMETKTIALQYDHYKPPVNSLEFTRKATMSAVTVPYLRAVVALFFHPDQATMKIIHPSENRLDSDELVGSLLLTYQSLCKSPTRDTVYFREMNVTHTLEGSYFAESLIKNLEQAQNPEVLIVNIHHDYLRLFHNMSDFQPILQVIKGICGDVAT